MAKDLTPVVLGVIIGRRGTDMTRDKVKALVARVKAGLRITKVVATRSVKGRSGDTFVGFSAAWNSVQEDGGQGVAFGMEDGDEAQSLNGMTMEEAIVASCIVAREADIAAYRNAAAGGNISADHANSAISSIRSNYSKMIVQVLGVAAEDTKGAPDGK